MTTDYLYHLRDGARARVRRAGLEWAQIATVLDISPSAVSQRLRESNDIARLAAICGCDPAKFVRASTVEDVVGLPPFGPVGALMGAGNDHRPPMSDCARRGR